MGIREKLEAIRANNESSYDDPYFGLARGPEAESIARRIGDPYRTIWTRPRATIRAIVAADPAYRVVAITLIAGFGRALNQAAAKDLGDHLRLAGVVWLCAVLGPLLTLLSLYLGGAILRITGGWLGGRASAAEVRAALAWASLPQVVVLLLWLPALVFVGHELFTAWKPLIMGRPSVRYALLAMQLADLVLLAWSAVLAVKCLAEVFRMSSWRVLVALLLMTPIFFGIVFVLVYAILIAVAGVLPDRPRPTALPGVRVVRPAPAPPARPAPPAIGRAKFTASDCARRDWSGSGAA